MGAGNSQQAQQLHGGVRGSSSSLGSGRCLVLGGWGARRPLLGSLKQAGPAPSSPPWGGRLRLRAYTRENQSGCERWALFFFLTEGLRRLPDTRPGGPTGRTSHWAVRAGGYRPQQPRQLARLEDSGDRDSDPLTATRPQCGTQAKKGTLGLPGGLVAKIQLPQQRAQLPVQGLGNQGSTCHLEVQPK